MNLIFERRDGTRITLLSYAETLQEIWDRIEQFLDDNNFKSYYKRVNAETDNSIWIDVGSYTEFFIVEGISLNEYIEALKVSNIRKV